MCVLFHLGGKIHTPCLMKLPLLTQEVQVHKETTRGLEGDGKLGRQPRTSHFPGGREDSQPCLAAREGPDGNWEGSNSSRRAHRWTNGWSDSTETGSAVLRKQQWGDWLTSLFSRPLVLSSIIPLTLGFYQSLFCPLCMRQSVSRSGSQSILVPEGRRRADTGNCFKRGSFCALALLH